MNVPLDKQIEDLEYIIKRSKELTKDPFFKWYSEEELLQLLMFGATINLDESITLGGEIRCLRDKIEMSPILMISLIKSKGHTITKDEKSNKEVCILHGERGDNGNPWTASFQMEVVQTPVEIPCDPRWKTHPEEKLFCRALSQLAFYLFTDVIGRADVDGDLEVNKIIELQRCFKEGFPADIEGLKAIGAEYEKKPMDYDINQLFKALEE